MSMDNTDATTPALHRILVVDDEEIVLVALRETLKREGYDVVARSNAVEALQLLKDEIFSVIITDQQMPMLTGLEFLAQVKELQPEATRILITAVLNLTTVIDAINKGEIYRFIVKPWLREELLATVKNAVNRYELICKNSMLQATTLQMNQKLKSLNKELEGKVTEIGQQNQQLAELNQALDHNLEQSVELCLKTMQTFYPSLGNQARKVQELCRKMANVIDLEKTERQTLDIAALLHDIGLVGVSRQLIKTWESEPSKLSGAERTLIEQHPVLGEELVGFVAHLKEVGPTIRAHHERFDGTGYPDKLKGDQIPWLARLLAVAIAYAQSEHTRETTLELIDRGQVSKYDPEAVRVLHRCLPRSPVPRGQREVLLGELEPGMVLATGIYTDSGMLLIPDGQELTETSITKILNHNRIQPLSQTLLVYC